MATTALMYTSLPTDETVNENVERLLASQNPFLIGVRHHSAAISRILPELLDGFKPVKIFLELPPDFQPWLEHLAADDLTAPVALAAASDKLTDLCFYPFADFSPELVCVRWAFQNDIPVVAFDLPLQCRTTSGREHRPESNGLLDRLLKRWRCQDVGTLWEKMVESPAVGADAESVRRAALLFGWALRCNDSVAAKEDLARETYMREQLTDAGRVATVVGSYHAAALLSEPQLWNKVERESKDIEVTTALIPYSFEQLDERSGYPAGIKDPVWHQSVVESADDEELKQLVSRKAVELCRHLRDMGHAANAPDAAEVTRVASDLASLRGNEAAGRGELLEAMQLCLVQGELLGRGRAVAEAGRRTLIGHHRGVLSDSTPRSGLAPSVEQLFKKLNLPAPESVEEKEYRLDPLRSKLDRARSVVFQRLDLCGIPYARYRQGEGVRHRENLTEHWVVQWNHATAAMLEVVASRGTNLEQAARGTITLRSQGLEAETEDDKVTVRLLREIEQAALCGLGDIVQDRLAQVERAFCEEASLGELTSVMYLIQRIASGHFPGLPTKPEEANPPYVLPFDLSENVSTTPLLEAAIGRLEGVFGSEDEADVSGLGDLVLWFQNQDDSQPVLAAGRFRWLMRRMVDEAGPAMQGAATAALMLLEEMDEPAFGNRMVGWIEAAVDSDGRRALRKRMGSALHLALPRLLGASECFELLSQRLAEYDDDSFLGRLPALRGAFNGISPANRQRILRQLLETLPTDAHATETLDDSPEVMERRANCDRAGQLAVTTMFPDLELDAAPLGEVEVAHAPTINLSRRTSQYSISDRWRLILGAQRNQLSQQASRVAGALSDLYGEGQGEPGSGEGQGGGQEQAFPNVREWAEELESLFSDDIREEVLAEAAGDRPAALELLDPDEVTPSIDLLEQVLSLKGALPESKMEHLRKLARRIVEQLARELAIRIQPALNGISIPRPTHRRTRHLDLQRTLRANLHTARIEDGQTVLVPERMIFRQNVQRSMDWHIIFVVDVSGSMEASVIYSAMMAAIFSSLPALSVQFLAFNVDVIELTEQVDDPLALLLEVEVGGGTHIAKGLRAARQRMTQPQRTIVVLVSDFEEGWPVGGLLAEVRALAETGAHLLGLAALNDGGGARYNKGIATQVAAQGMSVAALSPGELATWVRQQISSAR